MSDSMRTFIEGMPKCELHVHGSIVLKEGAQIRALKEDKQLRDK